MRILRVSFLLCAALAAGAQGWAQAPAGTVAPLSKKERIELCEKKIDVPFGPAEPQPLKVEGNVTRPVLLHKVDPGGYASRPRGEAVIEAVIDEDGCVRQPKVAKGQGTDLAAAVMNAVRRWVFEPATQDGRPVRVFYVVTFNAH
jgi:TonB family protein